MENLWFKTLLEFKFLDFQGVSKFTIIRGGVGMKKVVLFLWVLGIAIFTFSVSTSIQMWADWVKSNYDGTTITVAAQNHPSTDAMRKMASEFEKLTGIKVKWETMEEIHLHDKILIEFSSNTRRYDVLAMDVCWIGEFADKNVIAPLDDFVHSDLTPNWFDYEDITPAYREGLGMYNNLIYGIPSAGESAFIAYNKDLFKKYGLDPQILEDYDGLYFAAQKLNGAEKNLYGIAMRGRRGHHIVYAWLQFLYNFGGKIFDENYNVLLNSPEAIKSLQYYVDLMQFAPPGISNFSHEEATSAFMQGLTGLWFDATALAPWIEDASASLVAGKTEYLAPPGEYAAVGGWNLAVSSQSKNKEAAWEFIVYMLGRGMADEYIANGGVVTRNSILNDPFYKEQYAYYEAISQTLDKAYNLIEEGIDWRPRIPEWPQIGEIMGYHASMALAEKETCEEACQAMTKEIEDLLRNKGYYD